jgi:hypothetical protein
MAQSLFTGNPELQGFLAKRYQEYHQAGYSKTESHALAMQDLRTLHAQLLAEQQAQEQRGPNPFNAIIFDESGPI